MPQKKKNKEIVCVNCGSSVGRNQMVAKGDKKFCSHGCADKHQTAEGRVGITGL